MSRLSIEVRSLEGAGLVVHVRGELDLASSREFSTVLRATDFGAAARVVIDLAHLTFMDSNGLRAVLALRERARESGTDLALLRPSAAVLRLLEITGAGDVLPVITDLSDGAVPPSGDQPPGGLE